MQKAISTTEHFTHDEVSCYGVLLFRWKWGFNYKYQYILAQNLQASVRQLRLEDNLTFHDEDDQKHKSKSTKERLQKKGISVIYWPS